MKLSEAKLGDVVRTTYPAKGTFEGVVAGIDYACRGKSGCPDYVLIVVQSAPTSGLGIHAKSVSSYAMAFDKIDTSIQGEVRVVYMLPSDECDLVKEKETMVDLGYIEAHKRRLEKLARIVSVDSFRDRQMLVALARKAFHTDVLCILSKSPDALVRKTVAENPSTPRDTLARLMRDDYSEVREAAANMASESDLLAVLFDDAVPSKETTSEVKAKVIQTETEDVSRLDKEVDDEVIEDREENWSIPSAAVAIIGSAIFAGTMSSMVKAQDISTRVAVEEVIDSPVDTITELMAEQATI